MSLLRDIKFMSRNQGPIGTITIFCQCVSQKHAWFFVSWKIFGVSQKCGFWALFDKPEFPDFYGFFSHFPNLIEFQKDFQRASLVNSSNGSWSRADSQSCVRIQQNKNINLSESCSALMIPASLPYPTSQLKWRCKFVEMVCLNLS